MPTPTNKLTHMVESFYRANTAQGILVRNDAKDSGTSSLKGWKLNILKKVGVAPIASGTLLGRMAKGICGSKAINTFMAYHKDSGQALRALHDAYQEAYAPKLHDPHLDIRAKAAEIFRQPSDVTTANVEKFNSTLEAARAKHFAQLKHSVRVLEAGQYDSLIARLTPADAQRLLNVIQETSHGKPVRGTEAQFVTDFRKAQQFYQEQRDDLVLSLSDLHPSMQGMARKEAGIQREITTLTDKLTSLRESIETKLLERTIPDAQVTLTAQKKQGHSPQQAAIAGLAFIVKSTVEETPMPAHVLRPRDYEQFLSTLKETHLNPEAKQQVRNLVGSEPLSTISGKLAEKVAHRDELIKMRKMQFDDFTKATIELEHAELLHETSIAEVDRLQHKAEKTPDDLAEIQKCKHRVAEYSAEVDTAQERVAQTASFASPELLDQRLEYEQTKATVQNLAELKNIKIQLENILETTR